MAGFFCRLCSAILFYMAVDKKIKPELPGGVRDYLPQDAVVKERALARIKEVFSLFGFVPLETPGMERTEVLTGGDPQFSKELFYCTHKEEPNMDTALRFDLTVPLARVVAAHADVLHLPFRRYQIGSVWRGERQQAGRFKEFTQCDADIGRYVLG
jgi:histidyl-tRNA synthetase